MNDFKKWLMVVLSVSVISFIVLLGFWFLKGLEIDFNLSLFLLFSVVHGVVYATLSVLIDKFMCTR